MCADHELSARFRTHAGTHRDNVADFINLNIFKTVAREAFDDVFAAQLFTKGRGGDLRDFNLLINALIVLINGEL